MTDDQHGEGTPQGGGRWDPLPQGEYDDGATAFVELPEGGIDALLASADSPLAAPGHGYVPPQITVAPATTAGTDPAATGPWAAPEGGAQWHAPDVPEGGYPHQAQDPGYPPHDPGTGYPQGGDGGYPQGPDAGYGQHEPDAGYPQGFDGGYEQDPEAGYGQGGDAGYPYGAPAGYRQHDPYGVAGRQDGAQHDPHTGHEYAANDRFTYHPGTTGQWDFAEAAAPEDGTGAVTAPAPGHDVTGQWSIPVAGGDLPDESGEFTTSSLVEQWGGTPPATLPGGAPAPWVTPAAGLPAEHPAQTAHDGADPAAGDFAGHGGRLPDAAPVAPEHGTAPYDAEDAGEAVEQPEQPEPGETEEPGEPGTPEDRLPPQDAPESAEETSPPAAGSETPEGWQGAEAEEPGGSPEAPSEARDASEAPWSEAPSRAREAPEAAEAQDAAETQVAARVQDIPDTPEDSAAGETPDARHAPHAHDAQDAVPVPEHPAEPFAAPVAVQDAQTAPEAPKAPEAPETPEAATGPGTPDAPARASAPSPAGAADSADPGDGPDAAAQADAVDPVAQPDPAAQAAEQPDPEAPADPVDPASAPSPGPVPAPEDEPPADASAEPEEEQAAAPVAHDEHPLASYVLRVNGTDRPVTDAWIGESLLYVLRERLGLAGAKDGCSQGECGACNVQVDGRLVASCLVPAATAAGSEVRTVEGLAADGQPSDVQRALARCGAVQCGFCVPGMAMTVHDLLEGNPAPTELEARQALCGNLCRCSGYRGVLRAVEEVVAERGAHSAADAPETDAGRPRVPHQAGPGAGGAGPSPFDPPAAPGAPGSPEAPGPHDQPYGQDGGHA
ncbi:2Fe-2S iron-sulfur cluster-binding protein [Streptomyces sp. NPDC052020]|uniref:2Fe-2S iron-sulfur cluster-binding protein n=1 Tax=Streptomyces sp. NPDC052020 TaxID=3155677 RepID=UPI00341C3EB8